MFSISRVACATAIVLVLSLSGFASTVHADDRIVKAPAAAWVVPSEEAAATPASAGEGLRLLLLDTQLHAESDRQFFYVRTRSVALSPQGLLALGNITLSWSPGSQDIAVHHVTLIRDGQTIDVLASQDFATLRREENLDIATLDGRLTAVLQPAGLRVGDILDVAYTVTSRDTLPGERLAQSVDLNMPLSVGRQRVRASWPSAMPVTVRAANNWMAVPVRRSGGYTSFDIIRDNTQPILVPEDVPGRLQSINLIDVSAYRDWAEVAAVLQPLYAQARRLEADSPLHTEIARIRALSDDPAVQAAAALRLVQEQVRYVALLMDEGALTPATADDTWRRRFGDCKAKTALLLALLDQLGISGEAAAVSIMQGDTVGHRLPTIGAFDHVIVRATVGDKVYWLDGTRLGDRRLEDITVPPFRWALPLLATGAQLEQLDVAPLNTPQAETLLTIDASAGQHAPSTVTGSVVMRGETATALNGQLGLITAAQRDQGLRAMWAGIVNLTTTDEIGSTYDAEANVLTLTAKGTTRLDWTGEGLIPPGATYAPLGVEERTAGPFHDAPFVVAHPVFNRQFVTVRLPDNGRGFRVAGGQFDRTELGYHISRTLRIEGDTATVEVLVRSLVPEITAAEAEAGRLASDARPADYPRIIAPNSYRLTDADQAALSADTPTTESGWLDRAYALSRAGDNPGALDAAEQAVRLAPDSAAAFANRGVYKFWAGDREGAEADLNKAVDLDPSERIAMNGNALLANAEGRYQDVVIETSRALRQVPADTFALNLRGRAYLAQGQYDRALRDVDALIAAAPNAVASKLLRLSILEIAEREPELNNALTDILRQHPDDSRVVGTVAAYRLQQDKAQESWDILDALIRTQAEPDPELVIQRAEAAIKLNRIDDAVADFALVRAAAADNPNTLNGLCWTAALAGIMLDQALQDCDAALALAPRSSAILDSKARVLLQQGKAAEALEIYDAALAKTPDLPASLYGRGLARIALGRTEEGEADKAAAIALYAGSAEAFENYAPVEGAARP